MADWQGWVAVSTKQRGLNGDRCPPPCGLRDNLMIDWLSPAHSPYFLRLVLSIPHGARTKAWNSSTKNFSIFRDNHDNQRIPTTAAAFLWKVKSHTHIKQLFQLHEQFGWYVSKYTGYQCYSYHAHWTFLALWQLDLDQYYRDLQLVAVHYSTVDAPVEAVAFWKEEIQASLKGVHLVKYSNIQVERGRG